MDPRIKDILRYAFTAFLLLAGFLFGLKHYRIHEARKALVEELRGATSEASFYRQFERSDAESTLLKCVALMERGKELGLSTSELLDRVFKRKEKGEFDFGPSDDYPIREQLVRSSLTAAYEAAQRLEILDRDSLDELAAGRMPRASGGKPVIRTLIDPAIAPGLEKIVPNLEIRPVDDDSTGRDPNLIETAAARRLAKDLASADLIEDSVSESILDHYKTPTEDPDKR